METKADTPVTKDGMTKALGVVTSKIDDLIAMAPPEVASECTTFPSLLFFYGTHGVLGPSADLRF